MNETIFTAELKAKADRVVARYASRRAALLEILRLLTECYGYITPEIEKAVAEYLGIPAIDIREVMTFYTLFHAQPKAKRRFCICRSLSCALQGSEDILHHLEEKLGVQAGEKTRDGECSIETVECLGACEMAPMMQVNDREYVGPLTKKKIDELIKKWKN